MKSLLSLILVSILFLCLNAGFSENPKTGSGNPMQVSVGNSISEKVFFFGVNNSWGAGKMDPTQKKVQDILKQLQVRSLKFPGGAISNFWNLSEGRFVHELQIREFHNKKWANRFEKMAKRTPAFPSDKLKPFSFYETCFLTKINPVWVLNLVTESSDKSQKQITNMKTLNITPKYIELGSELDKGIFIVNFPTPEKYLQQAKPAISKIRELFPAAKTAVCASGVDMGDQKQAQENQKLFPNLKDRFEKWNTELFKFREDYDAWIVRPSSFTSQRFENVKKEKWQQICLVFPEAIMGNMAKTSREKFKSIPLWLTDFNMTFQLESTENQAHEPFFQNLKNSPLHGFHVAGYFLSAIANGDIFEIMHYNNLIGADGLGMIRLAPGKSTSKQGPKLQVNPAAQIFAIFSKLAQKAGMHQLEIKSGEFLDLNLLGRNNFHPLQGAAFTSVDSLAVVILNRSKQSQSIDLGDKEFLSSMKKTIYKIDPEPRETWADLTKDFPSKGPLIPQTQEIKVSPEKPLITDVPGFSLIILEGKLTEI